MYSTFDEVKKKINNFFLFLFLAMKQKKKFANI